MGDEKAGVMYDVLGLQCTLSAMEGCGAMQNRFEIVESEPRTNLQPMLELLLKRVRTV